MDFLSENKNIRLAVLQRVCTNYRAAVFKQLSSKLGDDFMLFIGEDVPDTKVKNSKNLKDINYQKLKTRFIHWGTRILPWHIGLIRALKKFNPDVILCEGESNFLGYVQAILYRKLYKKNVALMHWCFISLPGEPLEKPNFRSKIKSYFRNHFDAFVLYSSFSKERLKQLGQPNEKIFVATNVGDVQHFLNLSDSLKETKSEARQKIKLPDQFTVLYLGTLDENKRPEMMLELAKNYSFQDSNFVLLGTGSIYEKIKNRILNEKITNVYLPGRIEKELPLYLRSADVLMIPGRGGVVISEAMAFGIPVVVHQADGTEYDLIQNKITGLLLKDGTVNNFYETIKYMCKNIDETNKMGERAKILIKERLNTENMINQIINAAQYSYNKRKNEYAK
jgi:glycosyltransferase involved in cell wall biosynthesis